MTMTKTYFPIALLFCAICLISCSEEEEIVPLALEPLPEGSVAFLNISVGDESYNLTDRVDNSIFSTNNFNVVQNMNGMKVDANDTGI